MADPPGDPYGVELAEDENPDPNVLETTLVASEAIVDIGNGVMANMWTFNGLVPGPELRAQVGDTVIVHLENQLPQPMGIHWHGIELNNISDGTAITQNGVATGDSYLYRFIVPRPGVFWYHPHHHPTNPTFRGMYGSLVVTDPREDTLRTAGVLPNEAATKTLVLSDTTVCKAQGSNDAKTYPTVPAPPWAGNPTPYPGQDGPFPVGLCENPTALDEHGAAGAPSFGAGDIPNIQMNTDGRTNEGQTVLANGRNRGARAGSPESPGALAPGASQLDVQPGQGLRLQTINAAAVRYFRLRMTDATGTQIPLFRVGGEGGLLDQVRREGLFDDTFDKYSPGEILLGPGNRADIVVKIPDSAAGTITLWTLDVQRTGQGFAKVPTVPVMHLNPTGVAASFAIAEGDPLLTHPALGGTESVEQLPEASVEPLVDAAGFAPKTGSDNERIALGPVSIDGVRGTHDGGGADYRAVPHEAPTRYARVGDVLELTVKNETTAHHPFHLHGFSMQPIDFTRLTPDLTDDPAATEVLALGYNEFVDEIDVPALSTLRFRTRVDDRPMMDGVTPGGVIGRWVFHCHIFFHASLGMISEIVVLGAAGTDGNEKPFVNADDPSLEVDAGDPAAMTGTYADPEAGPVTLEASAGTVTDEGGGVWSWDDPAPTGGPVYITATDDQGYKAQDAFVVDVSNVAPTVTIDPAQVTTVAEGSTLAVSATFTDPGSGGSYSGSIDFGDGSGAQPFTPTVDVAGPPQDEGTITGSHSYGDNGTYTVTVAVSDGDLEGTATFEVTVTNVAPVVSGPVVASASLEGDLVSVTATFDDPGWLDTYPAATIDFGNGADAATAVVTTEGGPGPDQGTVSGSFSYGDNGTFPVTVTVTDDDGDTGQATFDVTVSNVDPEGDITAPPTVSVNGVPTVFADAAEPVTFDAQVVDPGSDDLTTSWAWDDGTPNTVQTSLVNPPALDPLPSPSVQPRNITHAATHAFAQACMYDVGFSSLDDDSGTDSDAVKVLITATPKDSRGAGYWQTAYKGTGGAGFTTAQKLCYLEISAFLSNVFNEVRDASTIDKAYDDIFVAGHKGSMHEQLDRQLLVSWLNFANGGVEYHELLDTNADDVSDTTFANVMATAEAVRLNPVSTRKQLQNQRDILTRINGRDGG